jgi:hypothetical protein
MVHLNASQIRMKKSLMSGDRFIGLFIGNESYGVSTKDVVLVGALQELADSCARRKLP